MKKQMVAMMLAGIVTWHTKAFDNTLDAKAFINQCLNWDEQSDMKVTNRTETDRNGFILWYPDLHGFLCSAHDPQSTGVCRPRCVGQ